MSMNSRKSTRGLRLILAAVLVAGSFPAAADDDSEIIPDEQCACAPADPNAVYPAPRGCRYERACFVQVLSEQAEVTAVGQTDETMTATLVCNNCDDPYNTMQCAQTLCVTKRDAGSVSGTAGFSVNLRGHINRLLAGLIGIETTAEFRAGMTSSTEVSTQYCVECGTAAPPCKAVAVELHAFGTPKSARVPLEHRWYVRLRCADATGPWTLNRICPGVAGWCTINGEKGSVSGCEAHALECPVCDNNLR